MTGIPALVQAPTIERTLILAELVAFGGEPSRQLVSVTRMSKVSSRAFVGSCGQRAARWRTSCAPTRVAARS